MFELGQVVMTQGITSAMEESRDFSMEVGKALEKYKLCDWGETSEADVESNNAAVKFDGKIFAVYETCKGEIWITTQCWWIDITTTTISFPSEY